MAGSFTPGGDAFETVAFLAGPPNRIAVLDALLRSGPTTWPSLVDELDASRVTVSRIVDDFESRNWVVHEGVDYRVTPVGEVICERFKSLLETVESMDELSSVLAWLPADFEVDVSPSWVGVSPLSRPSETR